MIEMPFGAEMLNVAVTSRHLALNTLSDRLRVYLAARYDRREELLAYAAALEALGFEITPRWIQGAHEWVSTPYEQMPRSVAAQFAIEDMADLFGADLLVCFTEQPGSGSQRGGRHVELGLALGRNIPVLTVGPIENVFYALGNIEVLDSWPEALALLSGMPSRLAREQERLERGMEYLDTLQEPTALELAEGTES